MALLGKGASNRAALLAWVVDENAAASDASAELGVVDGALGDLLRHMVAGEADVPAPFVQAVYSRERDFMEAFLLAVKSAWAGLPKIQPLRAALVSLDERARILHTQIGYLWQLMHFDANSAPTGLGGLALNRKERLSSPTPSCTSIGSPTGPGLGNSKMSSARSLRAAG